MQTPTPEPCPNCGGTTHMGQLDNGEKAQQCPDCGTYTTYLVPLE